VSLGEGTELRVYNPKAVVARPSAQKERRAREALDEISDDGDGCNGAEDKDVCV
jgi:hypothetical protein